MAELSEIDQLKLELKRKEVELEILKKYKELERKCRPSSCKVSGRIER